MGRHHPGNAGLDQRIAAGAGASVVAARLQRHVGGGPRDRSTLCLRVTQRHDLGMGAACTLCVALTHVVSMRVGDHATDARVWRSEVEALLRQAQGL
jgi:hypothetical protein